MQIADSEISYTNVETLKRFLSERGKIRSRRITGLSRRQQALAAREVKRARELSLLPYTIERASPGRGERGDRRERDLASVESAANREQFVSDDTPRETSDASSDE